jgi:ferritin-like metal-binding protein YciE
MPDQAYMQELFITGLKNAHGVEHQALQLMDRQIEHLENYPEVADMLRMHRAETETQIQRIDELLAGFDTSPSAVKDAVLSFTGNLAALAHMPAPDEILKNTFANHAFENFEIAAYTSLLTMADIGGFAQARGPLQQSLGEEQRMAQLVLDSVPMITRKYAELRSAGETAGH